MIIHPDSILMITLDSCRYDTFEQVQPPNMLKVGALHRAYAPGNFTYASHAAMFMGFTPGDPSQQRAVINPKYGKLFRMAEAGLTKTGDGLLLQEGRNIVDGLNRAGWQTYGTAVMGWFNPASETGRVLTEDFNQFYYPGQNSWRLEAQLQWVTQRLEESAGQPVFVFINIGETHVPYYYPGAPWSPADNPCVPFSDQNDADECRKRQQACLRYIDGQLADLLNAFAGSTTLICADHGDCWGEDGLWEHGIYHEKVLEVPLLYRSNFVKEE